MNTQDKLEIYVLCIYLNENGWSDAFDSVKYLE